MNAISDRSPKGEDPQGLHAKHESRVPEGQSPVTSSNGSPLITEAMIEKAARDITRAFWKRTYGDEVGTIERLVNEHWHVNIDLARACLESSGLAEAARIEGLREAQEIMDAKGDWLEFHGDINARIAELQREGGE